jgi:hypothetical protein
MHPSCIDYIPSARLQHTNDGQDRTVSSRTDAESISRSLGPYHSLQSRHRVRALLLKPMSRTTGWAVKGGAATTISSEGDIRLVFKLDYSWIVSSHLSFTTKSQTDSIARCKQASALQSHSRRYQILNQRHSGRCNHYLLGRPSNMAYYPFT